ncbi:MAG: S8 family serine peptidase [Haloarculaceae archaeon]
MSHVVEAGGIGPTVVGRWPEEALRGLRRNPHVRYVEEEQFDEPHYDLPDQILPWGLDRVDAEEAHDGGDTGSGVHVAISDSGIDADHPDLQGNLGTGYATDSNDCDDGSHPDGSCDEDWDDTDGHGTHVAGTVAGIANTEGVLGVAPDVTLHAVKIFPGGTHAQIKEGLVWAADQGYEVVNMSHGGSDSSTKKDGIEYAANAGMLLVSSAGNSGCCDSVGFPAAYDEVIAVSNVTDGDTISGSSSRGPEVDIAAPGDQIPSTWNDGEYNTISGTSMASPHVAGAGALLIEDGEDADGARTILESTAEEIGLTSNEQGNGLLDVAAALGYDSANDLLEVETLRDFPDTEFTEATLYGELTELTGNDSAEVFYQYRVDGTASWTNSPTETLTSAGPFDITVTGLEEDTVYEFRAGATVEEPAEGWSSTEYGDIEFFETEDNLPPNASFTVSPIEPNPGQAVTFDASTSDSGDTSDDSIVSYEWDLDDDGAFDDATGVTASRSYATGGNKTVGLIVTDEFDQTATTTGTFYVNKAPTASFTVSPDPVVRDESTTFDATGSFDSDGTVDLYEWDWDYDGSTFVVDENTTSTTTTHTFTTGGEHTVALRVTDNDGATDTTTMTFVVHIRVAIDVQPNGSGPNPINPDRNGNVPVAVLHTPAFDSPAELDPATVRFGDPDDVGFDAGGIPEGGATPAHPGGHVEDVDGDGDADSLFHFPVPDADFDSADTEGELVGLTYGGVPVFGTDSVRIVGGGRP